MFKLLKDLVAFRVNHSSDCDKNDLVPISMEKARKEAEYIKGACR